MGGVMVSRAGPSPAGVAHAAPPISEMDPMSRIEDYAIIGDLHTAAMVGVDGSVDWLCLPRFDSPACFAAVVGTRENGHWRIAPVGATGCTGRAYRPGSLILETEWQLSLIHI